MYALYIYIFFVHSHMLRPRHHAPGDDELQEAVRRSEERHKAQEAQLAELRERLQEAYEVRE